MSRVSPVTPAAEAAAAEELLRALRWTATEVDRVRVMRGQSRHLRGPGIRFLYVADGGATLARTGPRAPREPGRCGDDLTLRAGDFVLLTRGADHLVRAPAGREARLVTGGLTLDAAPFARVTELMPPVLFACGFRVREPAYRALLDQVEAEADASRPGAAAVLSRMIDLVVAATLRAWLESGCGSAHEWLAQLKDPHLGRVLDVIHADPGSPWTVEALARVASVSRSRFAERFRAVVGESPARYLTRVRMRRAEELLLAGHAVSHVAFTLGYDSDEGFRRAFQRHSGRAPSRWLRSVTSEDAPTPATAPEPEPARALV